MDIMQSSWLPSRTIRWLSRKLGVDYVLLQNTIEENKKLSSSLYQTIIVRRNGKKRKINIPNEDLKEIQKKINKRILAKIPKNPNIFGFSGGSIEDAISPHLGAEAIWTCDIKNAFPSMFRERVLGVFKRHFSESASQLLTLLTTISGKLPQGAPSSPRLFDLCLKTLDREFAKIAESMNGKYTRYADNLIFSGKKEYFCQIESEIFSWFQMAELTLHKVKIKDLDDQKSIRILGLNIIKKKLHNTRSFKKRLRLMIHHLNWMLSHEMKNTGKFEKAWRKLQGQMNFARIDTLPQKLLNDYLDLEKQLN